MQRQSWVNYNQKRITKSSSTGCPEITDYKLTWKYKSAPKNLETSVTYLHKNPTTSVYFYIYSHFPVNSQKHEEIM